MKVRTKVTKKSNLTGLLNTMTVFASQEDIDNCDKDAVPVAEAFPHLPEEQRAFLLTGTTESEWDNEVYY